MHTNNICICSLPGKVPMTKLQFSKSMPNGSLRLLDWSLDRLKAGQACSSHVQLSVAAQRPFACSKPKPAMGVNLLSWTGCQFCDNPLDTGLTWGPRYLRPRPAARCDKVCCQGEERCDKVLCSTKLLSSKHVFSKAASTYKDRALYTQRSQASTELQTCQLTRHLCC